MYLSFSILIIDMSSDDDKSVTAVKFPPSLVFIIMMLAAFVLHYLWPVGIGGFFWFKYVGALVIVFGLGIVLQVNRSFKQAGTNIEPWKPTTKIICTGMFAYSRNPVYVGFCCVPIGLGMFLNSLWLMISFVFSAVLIYYLAIEEEEAYLEKKFGEEYTVYKSKVRRWL